MITFKEYLSYGSGHKYCDILRSHDNIGIPRSDMPQLSDESSMKFLSWLSEMGIVFKESTNFSVGMVRFSQEDINLEKIKEMISSMGWEGALSNTPYLISEDDYLLDGHHRFIAELYGDSATNVHVIKIMLPIRALILLANRFIKGLDTNDNV